MTLRLPLLAAALVALAVAGCQGGVGDAGTADLEGIEEAGPFDQVAYNVGFQTGQQFLAQDSSFNFDRFLAGFRKGVDGDSTELAYAVGVQYGLQVRQDTLGAIDRDVFLAGVRSALAREEGRVTPEQFQAAQAVVEDSLEIRRLRGQAARDPLARQRLDAISRNAAQADSFLAAVRQRPGVRELGDGVLYTVTTPGQGASPTAGDQVAVRYRGTFLNGEEFDASGEEPAVFGVGQVVPGFRDALLAMKPGETRTIYLPPDQAYGLMGQPGPGGQGGIPPNSPLVFEVTLVEVLGGAPQMPPGMFGPPQ